MNYFSSLMLCDFLFHKHSQRSRNVAVIFSKSEIGVAFTCFIFHQMIVCHKHKKRLRSVVFPFKEIVNEDVRQVLLKRKPLSFSTLHCTDPPLKMISNFFHMFYKAFDFTWPCSSIQCRSHLILCSSSVTKGP